jgi:hypothetical protein
MQLARLCDLLSRQPVRIKRRPHATKVHVENPWVFNVFQWNYGLNIHMLSSYVIKPKCWIHYMGRQVFFSPDVVNNNVKYLYVILILWCFYRGIWFTKHLEYLLLFDFPDIFDTQWSMHQTVSQKIHQSSPKCICMHLLQFPITKSVGL